MSKIKGVLLTEGMHGMISQVEGLAKALDLNFIHRKVELNHFWRFLPPKITPIKQFILKEKIESNAKVVISCGRKSVIPSMILKKKYKEKIFTIHIQNPKVGLNNFDLIIVPEHDNLRGENVISSKGAIHYITKAEIEKSKSYLTNKITSNKIVALILGGPNKYYDFSVEELTKVFNEIKSKFISLEYKIVVVPSMRTPKTIIDLAFKEFVGHGYVVQNIDRNAYLASLGLAKNIIVTCDSTSMISEAATSGKPVFIAHMKAKKNNYRFKKFFQLFREMGITRNLGEKIEDWSYNYFNEAERIAKIVKEKWNI